MRGRLLAVRLINIICVCAAENLNAFVCAADIKLVNFDCNEKNFENDKAISDVPSPPLPAAR